MKGYKEKESIFQDIPCSNEDIASLILNEDYIGSAMDGDEDSQKFLVDLFGEPDWESVKEKLEDVDRLDWYFWYMKGIHKFMKILQEDNEL